MTLSELFDTFQNTAFRLEGLPVYKVSEEANALKYYEKYGYTPGSFNEDWAALVKERTNKGQTIQRLRLLSNKPTDYEVFEINSYSGLRAGEDIHIAQRSEHPFEYDFWIFDNKWLARMVYAADGTFLNCVISEVSKEDLEQVNYWLSVFKSAECLNRIVH